MHRHPSNILQYNFTMIYYDVFLFRLITTFLSEGLKGLFLVCCFARADKTGLLTSHQTKESIRKVTTPNDNLKTHNLSSFGHRIVTGRVKIKGVLQGVMASDSEPGNFFSFHPNSPLESRFQPQLTLWENIQKRSK